jgi:hypothetical protein
MRIHWLLGVVDGAVAKSFGVHKLSGRWAYLAFSVDEKSKDTPASSKSLYEKLYMSDGTRMVAYLRGLSRSSDSDELADFVESAISIITRG